MTELNASLNRLAGESEAAMNTRMRANIDSFASAMSLPNDTLGKMVADMLPSLQSLNNSVSAALDDMSKPGNASDPAKLATYQTATSQYNIYRQLVSSAIKEKRDLDLAIIRNIG